METMMKKLVPVLEGIVQAFVALGALPCGVLLMVYPNGSVLNMPLSMLKGSPFADFFWPGLILFTVEKALGMERENMDLFDNRTPVMDYSKNCGRIVNI
jgi:hypothetical protein